MTAKAVVASLLITGIAFATVPAKKKKKAQPFLMDKSQDMGPQEIMDPNCTALGNGYVLYFNAKTNHYGIASTCTAAITDATVNEHKPPTYAQI